MTYRPEAIEQYLPLVWDWQAKIEDPYAPDPDMPKVKANPKTGGTELAIYADLRNAYENGGLTLNDKRALFLRYGLGWTQKQIGTYLGLRQQLVSDRLGLALARVRLFLNGPDDAANIDDIATPCQEEGPAQ